MLQFTLRALRGRRLAVALFCALATALLGASAAQATVTTTTITSPSDPFYGFDQGQTQNVTISGTSDGNAADSVDILCYNDDGSTGTVSYTVASGVAVDGSGNFSTSVSISQLVDAHSIYSAAYCRLRAVPAGTQPTTGLSSYSGPRSLVGYLNTYTNGSQTYDYYIESPQLTAADDYNSYNSCGLADSYLFDPTVTGQRDSIGFYCNDFPDNPAASDHSRSGIQVDGQNAYGSYYAWAINRNASGIEGLTINSVTQDSGNGDLTIVETEPILECVGNPFPANSGNCTAFVSSGVQVRRTITQTSDGHIVYVDDAYSSTDGSAHAVSLLLENDQSFSSDGGLGGDTVSYQFPGSSSFSTYSAGGTVSVPATSPASILIENNTTPDGSTSGARGAITYGQVPSNPFAFSLATNVQDSVFDASNDITVPASGSVAIRYAYSTDYTLAAAQANAATAEDQFQGVQVSISSPANGATESSSSVTVTGSASAGSGVKSVTVNGVAATLSGGSFSATVPLSKGSNTLTAVATSNGGASASASETVTYATPAAAVAPVAHTGSAKSVKTTSAVLTGTVTPGSASTTYRFEYGKSTSYGKTTAVVTLAASSSASSVSATVKGLAANTTYHFRLVASSSVGSSTGQDVKFHTAKVALKLSVSSGHAQAGTRRCYAFKASASAHPVSGATVLFAHHRARTSHSGKATLCLTLARGVYHPTVSKAGFKSGHATVMVRPAKPSPTFTG